MKKPAESVWAGFWVFLSIPGYIFTSGATEALNTVLGGLLLDGEILVTQTEHNSVLRPVRNLLSAQKLEMKVIPCEKDGRITLAALESSVTSRTRAIVVNHCSNVTGCIQDMDMWEDLQKNTD